MGMDASALTHASRLGLLGRRSPLLRLQGDDRLIALMRTGQPRAFEALVERYQNRLLAFCRGMLASPEDAEDVLQDVLVAAHKAILADNRAINAKPWLYRIARNRCLNHLRKPVPEGQDSMDIHPHERGESVAECVQNREEFRALIDDVHGLPETQRTALLLREIEDLGYEEIAVAMETTVPAVKSLLVRARMSLADSSQGRHLTCDEVHLELAEAAEGLRKASGPARSHMRGCERCRDYRRELRRNRRALAALAPIGPLAALHGILTGKLSVGAAKVGLGSGGAGGTAAAGSGGAGAIGMAGGAAAAGGIGGTIGAKAAIGVAGLALLGAGASEIRSTAAPVTNAGPAPAERATIAMSGGAPYFGDHDRRPGGADKPKREADAPAVAPIQPVPADPVLAVETGEPTPPTDPAPENTAVAVTGSAAAGGGFVEATNEGGSSPIGSVPGDPIATIDPAPEPPASTTPPADTLPEASPPAEGAATKAEP